MISRIFKNHVMLLSILINALVSPMAMAMEIDASPSANPADIQSILRHIDEEYGLYITVDREKLAGALAIITSPGNARNDNLFQTWRALHLSDVPYVGDARAYEHAGPYLKHIRNVFDAPKERALSYTSRSLLKLVEENIVEKQAPALIFYTLPDDASELRALVVVGIQTDIDAQLLYLQVKGTGVGCLKESGDLKSFMESHRILGVVDSITPSRKMSTINAEQSNVISLDVSPDMVAHLRVSMFASPANDQKAKSPAKEDDGAKKRKHDEEPRVNQSIDVVTHHRSDSVEVLVQEKLRNDYGHFLTVDHDLLAHALKTIERPASAAMQGKLQMLRALAFEGIVFPNKSSVFANDAQDTFIDWLRKSPTELHTTSSLCDAVEARIFEQKPALLFYADSKDGADFINALLVVGVLNLGPGQTSFLVVTPEENREIFQVLDVETLDSIYQFIAVAQDMGVKPEPLWNEFEIFTSEHASISEQRTDWHIRRAFIKLKMLRELDRKKFATHLERLEQQAKKAASELAARQEPRPISVPKGLPAVMLPQEDLLKAYENSSYPKARVVRNPDLAMTEIVLHYANKKDPSSMRPLHIDETDFRHVYITNLRYKFGSGQDFHERLMSSVERPKRFLKAGLISFLGEAGSMTMTKLDDVASLLSTRIVPARFRMTPHAVREEKLDEEAFIRRVHQSLSYGLPALVYHKSDSVSKNKLMLSAIIGMKMPRDFYPRCATITLLTNRGVREIQSSSLFGEMYAGGQVVRNLNGLLASLKSEDLQNMFNVMERDDILKIEALNETKLINYLYFDAQ